MEVNRPKFSKGWNLVKVNNHLWFLFNPKIDDQDDVRDEFSLYLRFETNISSHHNENWTRSEVDISNIEQLSFTDSYLRKMINKIESYGELKFFEAFFKIKLIFNL